MKQIQQDNKVCGMVKGGGGNRHRDNMPVPRNPDACVLLLCNQAKWRPWWPLCWSEIAHFLLFYTYKQVNPPIYVTLLHRN